MIGVKHLPSASMFVSANWSLYTARNKSSRAATVSHNWWKWKDAPLETCSAVALAFGEIRTNICVQKFGNAYQQNWETNGTFQKYLYHHQTIQRNIEMLFANDARFPFTILACLPWSFVSCVVWNVLRLNPAFAYAVRTTSMVLRTARFVCVPYAEICVNANAACWRTV